MKPMYFTRECSDAQEVADFLNGWTKVLSYDVVPFPQVNGRESWTAFLVIVQVDTA